MRKLIILLFIAILALGTAYKLGYLDRQIKIYILKEKIANNKASATTANESITVHNATIQRLSNKDNSAILLLTLKNQSNKTHELIGIEVEQSKNKAKLFESMTPSDSAIKKTQEVFGVPIGGFSIVKFSTESHFAQIHQVSHQSKSGDSTQIKLIFSDHSEKSISAIFKKK